jgi:transglutaminase-like putative cysteine protease
VLIRLGYDLSFDVPAPVAMAAMLHVYPSRAGDLLHADNLHTDPCLPVRQFTDAYGNWCSRFLAPAGKIRLWNSTMIKDSGEPDPVAPDARQIPVERLPDETLQYLLSTRYCEVDRLSNIALELFGHIEPGWARAQAICDWVHQKVTFGYQFARPTKTALDVYTERNGVCRDFQHLAVTFCRCLNIPARYVTGYLGDIGVPPVPSPMDFSAWFEVYLDDQWWAFDARHNRPRIGRVLMAVGRDAADVAITTSFGLTHLTNFTVVTEEVAEGSLEIEAASRSAETQLMSDTGR